MAKQAQSRAEPAKAGAVDAAVKDVTLALVGPAADVALARRWLARLNGFAVARESNSRRYRDWPGAKRALGINFVIEDRFVRPLDDERLKLAMSRPSLPDRFEDLLDLFDAKIQTFFGDTRPDCIIVCLPDEAAALRLCSSAQFEIPTRQAWDQTVVMPVVQVLCSAAW